MVMSRRVVTLFTIPGASRHDDGVKLYEKNHYIAMPVTQEFSLQLSSRSVTHITRDTFVNLSSPLPEFWKMPEITYHIALHSRQNYNFIN